MNNSSTFYDIYSADLDADQVVTAHDILSRDEPFVLFIGGLFHLAGYGNGGGLRSFLDRVRRPAHDPDSSLPAYYIQERVETQWTRKLKHGNAFMTEGSIDPSSADLVDRLIIPDQLLDPNNTVSANAHAVARHLSNVTLIGYSFGTVINQQINHYARAKLENAGFSSELAELTLNSLMAVNAGPAGRFRDATQGMVQMTVVERDDMMTHELSDYAYPSINEDGLCVTADQIGTHTFIIPETGTPTVRAVIEKTGNNGEIDSKLVYESHEEEHGLLMYFNTSETYQFGNRTIHSYASQPTSEIIRSFNAAALSASLAAHEQGIIRDGKTVMNRIHGEMLSADSLRELALKFAAEEQAFIQGPAAGVKAEFKKSFWKKPDFMAESHIVKKRPSI